MDPSSCSKANCDIYEGTSNVPSENSDHKTVSNASVVIKEEENTEKDRQKIDDIEREDFDEENRIIKHCTGMIVDGKIAATAHYSGNLPNADSSLTPSLEAIPGISNVKAENYGLPGCSKTDDCEDSNTTIKNMIRSKIYVNEQVIRDNMYSKADFMRRLLNNQKKDLTKGKLYKGDLIEGSCDAEISESCDDPTGTTSSNTSSTASTSTVKSYPNLYFKDPLFPGKLISHDDLVKRMIQEKKDFPKGKLYKGDIEGSCDTETSESCDGPSGRTSSNASSTASTSTDVIYPNLFFKDPLFPGKLISHENLMKRALSRSTQEKKDFPKGKLYKGDLDLMDVLCETEISHSCVGPTGRTSSNASSIASTSSDMTKEFSVASTSNAEKLLGLDGSKSEPGSSKSSSYLKHFHDGDDDSDDDVNEESCCTCLSSHEDGEDDDDPELEERNWRKRRYEPQPSQCMKKFCTETSMSGSSASDSWSNNLANGVGAAANVQGPPELKHWLNRFQSWSNGEKIQAIDSLIRRCDASQVRHMMNSIEPLFQRDFISLLPKELALTVLGYLQPKDLLRAAQTCRYWRFLADDNLLWKDQCRRKGIKTAKKIPRMLHRCVSPWKATYIRQYLIENNWLLKAVKKPIVMRGHEDHVITCLQFSGNRILSGSDDTTLKVWSAVTGKCLRTLMGHSGGVWSSQMVGDLVISGSTDRTLRVWNANTGECLNVLTGHTSTVRCMHLHQNRVVSGSRDATLRVWSIPDGRCLRVLVGHLAAVRCVQYDGKVVVSGAYDYFVKVWNPETGECLHTLAGHTNRVYSLQFDGVHVVSGSLDTSIRVWDVESGQLKHTLTGHQSLTSGMELHSNILVSGNADSTVKVWDITTGHCLHTLSGPNKHQSAVTCLQSSNRFVITSSDDGTVKLWDVRTGEFIRNLVELSSGGLGGVVWRIRASATKLICAVGSRNGTEETKLLVLDFDVPGACRKCDE